MASMWLNGGCEKGKSGSGKQINMAPMWLNGGCEKGKSGSERTEHNAVNISQEHVGSIVSGQQLNGYVKPEPSPPHERWIF